MFTLLFEFLLQNKRHSQFKTMKATIVKLLEDLDQSPDTSLAVNVVCEEEESFLLSTDRLKHMKVYQDEVSTRLYVIRFLFTSKYHVI